MYLYYIIYFFIGIVVEKINNQKVFVKFGTLQMTVGMENLVITND